MQQADEQITLLELEREIRAELKDSTPLNDGEASIEDPASLQQHAARKAFRINDFDSPRDKEMAVFTHAKKLSEYIFVITEKSPKNLRWSIVTRLQNASVDVVENLYRANFERDEEKRIKYQKSAAVSLSLLDFYTDTARRKRAITIHHTAVIAKQLAETKKLLSGWIKSTKRR